MGRLPLTLCLTFLVMATVTFGMPPKKAVDVPFGRNYFPTWAFDHIKYLNGGSEVHLILDKHWLSPSKDYHSYSVLWNMYQIVFFVDDVPIRVFKNSKDIGVKFPFNQPMKIYSSLWNADDWATRGGLEKTNWAKAPFVASYRGFHVDGCEASVNAKFCETQGKRWWDQKEFQDLDAQQYKRLKWVRTRYTIYNYCTDRVRFPVPPPECRRDRDI
ncbi:hypothetical protein F2Q68_00022811 [Brassica cretica]|uniref:Xyloglucan endotransglucosylase/hydrolase n=1 Tax=Brassica cretica TaxID=69181 RepID=A0A8S9FU01_BRACR|nr:hypothetical protein F2Q68_00022811 [Brassica cretica]